MLINSKSRIEGAGVTGFQRTLRLGCRNYSRKHCCKITLGKFRKLSKSCTLIRRTLLYLRFRWRRSVCGTRRVCINAHSINATSINYTQQAYIHTVYICMSNSLFIGQSKTLLPSPSLSRTQTIRQNMTWQCSWSSYTKSAIRLQYLILQTLSSCNTYDVWYCHMTLQCTCLLYTSPSPRD